MAMEKKTIVSWTKVTVLFLDRMEFLDRLKGLDRPEYLDRMDCFDSVHAATS